MEDSFVIIESKSIVRDQMKNERDEKEGTGKDYQSLVEKMKILQKTLEQERAEKENLQKKFELERMKLQEQVNEERKEKEQIKEQLANMSRMKQKVVKNSHELRTNLQTMKKTCFQNQFKIFELRKVRDKNTEILGQYNQLQSEVMTIKLEADEKAREEIKKNSEYMKRRHDAMIEELKFEEEKKAKIHLVEKTELEKSLGEAQEELRKKDQALKISEEKWINYQKERNEELKAIAVELKEIEDMTRSKFSFNRRPMTRRNKIKLVCDRLDARSRASM